MGLPESSKNAPTLGGTEASELTAEAAMLETTAAQVDVAHLLDDFRTGNVEFENMGLREDQRLAFENENLQGERLIKQFPGRRIVDAAFLGCDLRRVDLSRFHFQDVDLSGSTLVCASLRDTTVIHSNMNNTVCAFSDWNGAVLAKCTLAGAVFTGADVSNCNFSECDLTGADFRRVRAVNANFSGAMLHDCDFSGADLMNVNISNAELSKTDFSYARLEGLLLFPAAFRAANYFNVKILRNQRELTPLDWPSRPPRNGIVSLLTRLKLIEIVAKSPLLRGIVGRSRLASDFVVGGRP